MSPSGASDRHLAVRFLAASTVDHGTGTTLEARARAYGSTTCKLEST